jgi:hypothetical protein
MPFDPALPLDYAPSPAAHGDGAAAPSRARWWFISSIFRHDQDDLLLAAAALAAWFVVRQLNRGKARRLSYLAVFSALAAVLNPMWVEHFLRVAGLPTVGRGDSEMQSFRTAALAAVAGVIAAVRIARSRRTLWGLPFAGSGVAVATLVVVSWIAVLIALVGGMGGH